MDAQSDNLHSLAFAGPSVTVKTLCILLALWFAAVLLFLCNRQYTRTITVNGWLSPPQGITRVYSGNHSGVVSQLLVREGDHISAGQPLAILHADQQYNATSALGEALAQENQQQINLLKQKADAAFEHFTRQNKQYSDTLVQLQKNKTLRLKLRQLASQKQQLLAEKVARMKPVAGIHIARNDFDALYSEWLYASQQVTELDLQLAADAQQQTDTRHQLTQVEARYQQTSLELQELESQLLQKQARFTHQQSTTIVATTPGIISSLAVQAGDTVYANRLLATVVPAQSELHARLMVPAYATGMLNTASDVRLRFDAFPYQKFGLQTAQITAVSPGVLLPEDIDAPLTAITEPVSVATASIDSQFITAYGEDIALKPGMTFSADIALSRRSLIEWLAEPLLTISGRW